MTRNAIALSLSNLQYNYIPPSHLPKKGANARRGRRLLPSGFKKTKALLKLVTGNGDLGACQDIVRFKNCLRAHHLVEPSYSAGKIFYNHIIMRVTYHARFNQNICYY